MITPPPPPRRPESPPPMVRLEPLQVALLNRDPNEVLVALQEDDTAAILPLRQRHGGAPEPPLVVAVRGRCLSPILKLLLKYGADVDDTGPSGDTALIAVAATRPPLSHEQIEGRFPFRVKPPPCASVAAQLDEKIQNRDERKPAVFAGEPAKPSQEDSTCSLALCLLQAKADPDQVNKKGNTAAQIAREHERPQLASLLENWRNWEACQYLQALWHRQDGESGYAPNLVQCPADIYGLLCSMIAPWPPPDAIGKE